ncbi:hypothetical protein L226DRAFT_537923 [Lentinus tigrinus ALCF2SS1-7]|uniref:F-box domain-containing protein n=1 Tax=Lentinus tigrinus ALCF2SS1-6 TaxID=1328759 RepID=A0A5C2RZW8_9APHY|nr:hypothetical protein L227DRAFT_248374 [Lentinus tigrinus ALCF2SS1-6]RPD71657.1 hypothetical protein L226DRAFT_537923 [Lentinus tigrinus ALCF2SS1-7]
MAGNHHAHGFPVELLEMIFEEADLETQKACSLVDHVWLEVARRYLFDIIVFRSDTSFDSFLRFFAAHPHIRTHTRSVRLLGPEMSDPFRQPHYPFIDPATLADIVTSTPNISSIQLKSVILVNTPEDKKPRLASLSGPIRLTEFSMMRSPDGHDHSPVAVLELFRLFETKFIQIQLASFWAPSALEGANNAGPVVPRWRVRHQGICIVGITTTRPTPLMTLTETLVPGSLKQLHLDFRNWSHLHEMARFLQYFGESITNFTISFAYALARYEARDHTPSDEEWSSYRFSSLRNLSKLQFNLSQALMLPFSNGRRTWTDSTGIPKFLACFPRSLPLQDGVYINLRYVGDIPVNMYPGPINPRPEIENALFRFDNLKRVTLCSWYECSNAGVIGAQAFPRLYQAKKLVCMDEVKKCC